jgi:hypothetical protein
MIDSFCEGVFTLSSRSVSFSFRSNAIQYAIIQQQLQFSSRKVLKNELIIAWGDEALAKVTLNYLKWPPEVEILH